MTFRLTPALSILILAGCASSEPQNVSYAPLAAQPMTMQAAPLPAPAMAGPTTTGPAVTGPSVTEPSMRQASMAAGDTSLTSVPLPGAAPDALMSAPPADALLAVPASAPATYDQTIPANEADIAAGVPADATNCSTVDGVTLCDAPFDPVVDATHNTN